MPSPVGHGLAALTLHALSSRREDELKSPRRAAVLVAAAVAPDLDLLLRYIDGRNHHQAECHSVGCAVLAGLVVWVAGRVAGWERPRALAVWAGGAWLSHVLLDYLGRDTHPPIGLMALWPFAVGYFKSPWPIFLDIGRTLEWETLRNNAVAVAWEAALLLPPLIVSCRARSRSLLGRGVPAGGPRGERRA